MENSVECDGPSQLDRVEAELSEGAAEASGPLLRLLGAPDGLSGDAEGPRHHGLGLPVAAQQPDGGGLVRGQCLGAAREPAFLRWGCPGAPLRFHFRFSQRREDMTTTVTTAAAIRTALAATTGGVFSEKATKTRSARIPTC